LGELVVATGESTKTRNILRIMKFLATFVAIHILWAFDKSSRRDNILGHSRYLFGEDVLEGVLFV
jgi:hypothetical protein